MVRTYIPFWVLFEPFGVQTGMVGNHITGQTDTPLPGTGSEVLQCIWTTNTGIDLVFFE